MMSVARKVAGSGNIQQGYEHNMLEVMDEIVALGLDQGWLAEEAVVKRSN
jgi:hypothetical protein